MATNKMEEDSDVSSSMQGIQMETDSNFTSLSDEEAEPKRVAQLRRLRKKTREIRHPRGLSSQLNREKKLDSASMTDCKEHEDCPKERHVIMKLRHSKNNDDIWFVEPRTLEIRHSSDEEELVPEDFSKEKVVFKVARLKHDKEELGNIEKMIKQYEPTKIYEGEELDGNFFALTLILFKLMIPTLKEIESYVDICLKRKPHLCEIDDKEKISILENRLETLNRLLPASKQRTNGLKVANKSHMKTNNCNMNVDPNVGATTTHSRSNDNECDADKPCSSKSSSSSSSSKNGNRHVKRRRPNMHESQSKRH